MSIGQYKYKIDFVSYTSTDDPYGGTLDTPAVVLTTWAQQVPLRAFRQNNDHQLGITNVATFRIRWRKEFTPDVKMKIRCMGKEYAIHEPVEVNANHRQWEITAYDQTIAEENSIP